MTTGVAVAYQGMFEVVVYNLQKPGREGVLPDYSKDYYDRIIA